MQLKFSYIYAVGSGEELNQGDFDVLGISDNFQGLERYLQKKESMIIPRFVGVYQKSEIILEQGEYEETERQEQQEFANNFFQGASEILNLAFSFNGREDNTHPDLIHITYNPQLWTEKLVKECIGDNNSRLAFSEYKKLPAFANKDTDLTIKFWSSLISEKPEVKKYLQLFEEQRKTYGLTRIEYAFPYAYEMMGDRLITLLTNMNQ